MMKIEQKHREEAANKIAGDDEKSTKIRKKIVDGLSDDHPSVQAAAFYDK